MIRGRKEAPHAEDGIQVLEHLDDEMSEGIEDASENH